jgi:GT2 family glycosyltransferase
MNPSSSVLAIMVNWNGKVFLQNSIQSVLCELSKADGKMLVVDNASTDGSVEFLKIQYPQVKILQTGDNLGGAGGFRTGMRYALSQSNVQYVWLLDNDIVVEQDSLAPLVQVLQENERAGAAGSQICMYDRPDTVQEVGANYTVWLGALKQHGSGGKRLPVTTKPFEVDYLAACSVLIKKQCLEQTGVFGDFFIFYDDMEWGLRAKKYGWQLYAVPASVISHHYNMIKPVVPWREYYRKRNRLAVIASYPPSRGGHLAIIVYLIFVNYSILMYQWRRDRSLYRALLWARDDAISRNLGKRDLSGLDTDHQYKIQVPEFSEEDRILIDISESAGNALAAINRIKETHFAKHISIFVEQHEYLKYFDVQRLEVAEPERNYDVVIVGKNCHYRNLRRGKVIYRFFQGAFSLIEYPLLEYLIDGARRMLAMTIAVCLAPFQGVRLIWRYRDKGLSTFLRD